MTCRRVVCVHSTFLFSSCVLPRRNWIAHRRYRYPRRFCLHREGLHHDLEHCETLSSRPIHCGWLLMDVHSSHAIFVALLLPSCLERSSPGAGLMLGIFEMFWQTEILEGCQDMHEIPPKRGTPNPTRDVIVHAIKAPSAVMGRGA